MGNTREEINNAESITNGGFGYSKEAGTVGNTIGGNLGVNGNQNTGVNFGSNVGGSFSGSTGEISGIKVVTEGTNNNSLPVKNGFWSKVKSMLFREIKVELTPYQQKVEDEINEFLHQEITWKKVKNFLFQEIKF